MKTLPPSESPPDPPPSDPPEESSPPSDPPASPSPDPDPSPSVPPPEESSPSPSPSPADPPPASPAVTMPPSSLGSSPQATREVLSNRKAVMVDRWFCTLESPRPAQYHGRLSCQSTALARVAPTHPSRSNHPQLELGPTGMVESVCRGCGARTIPFNRTGSRCYPTTDSGPPIELQRRLRIFEKARCSAAPYGWRRSRRSASPVSWTPWSTSGKRGDWWSRPSFIPAPSARCVTSCSTRTSIAGSSKAC